MNNTNPINKDDAGYTTLLAALFVMTVAAAFISADATAYSARAVSVETQTVVVPAKQMVKAHDVIVVTATRLK